MPRLAVADDVFDDAEVTIAGSRAAIESDAGWCVYAEQVDGSRLIAAVPLPDLDGLTTCALRGDLRAGA